MIDIIGYRRHGHQEQDEPAYTPLMAAQIERQPSVRERYASALVAEGVVSEEEAQATSTRPSPSYGVLMRRSSRRSPSRSSCPPATRAGASARPRPSSRRSAAARLEALNEQLLALPERFAPSEKLLRQLERRRETIRTGGIDWGQAEALAFASLLEDGIPIRLTGQDTERGTFAHRHLVLHDQEQRETFTPIQNLSGANASFEVYNSPLSEFGVLGFEFGYSIAAPDALVLWEAQFGDFANGAQIVIDQFVVAGRSKWGQTSRLVAAPARLRGNGPEHSSARLERFLQLGAQENIRVVNARPRRSTSTSFAARRWTRRRGR